MPNDFVRGLKCRLCGKMYPKEPLNFCTEDFGPLEVELAVGGAGLSVGEDVEPAADRGPELSVSHDRTRAGLPSFLHL